MNIPWKDYVMLNKIIDIVKECGLIIRNAQIHNIMLKNEDKGNVADNGMAKIIEALQETHAPVQKLNKIL